MSFITTTCVFTSSLDILSPVISKLDEEWGETPHMIEAYNDHIEVFYPAPEWCEYRGTITKIPVIPFPWFEDFPEYKAHKSVVYDEFGFVDPFADE